MATRFASNRGNLLSPFTHSLAPFVSSRYLPSNMWTCVCSITENLRTSSLMWSRTTIPLVPEPLLTPRTSCCRNEVNICFSHNKFCYAGFLLLAYWTWFLLVYQSIGHPNSSFLLFLVGGRKTNLDLLSMILNPLSTSPILLVISSHTETW